MGDEVCCNDLLKSIKSKMKYKKKDKPKEKALKIEGSFDDVLKVSVPKKKKEKETK